MQAIPFITDLKWRAGWGKTGNQDGISDYNPYQTFTNDYNAAGYSLSGVPNGFDLGFARYKFGNPQGRWESTTSTNLGLDVSVLHNQIEVNFDWFNRQTDDILLPLPLPAALGYAYDQTAYNVGRVRNRGVDLAVNYRDQFVGKKLIVKAGLIFSTYRNKVLLIEPGNDLAFLTDGDHQITRSQKGYPISSIYGYVIDGIFQSQEEAAAAPLYPGCSDATVYVNGVAQKGVGKFRYRDISGPQGVPDGKIDDNDRTFIGNPNPQFTYGFNISVAYKGWEATAFLQGVQGNDVFNLTKSWTDFSNVTLYNRSTRVLTDSWVPGKTDAKLPIPDENDFVSGQASTYFVEKGSYMRVKNLQLSYTFPKAWLSRMGLSQSRVYVQGLNLFTVTSYSGLEPELSLSNNNQLRNGIDKGVFPTPRTYTLGLNLAF